MSDGCDSLSNLVLSHAIVPPAALESTGSFAQVPFLHAGLAATTQPPTSAMFQLTSLESSQLCNQAQHQQIYTLNGQGGTYDELDDPQQANRLRIASSTSSSSATSHFSSERAWQDLSGRRPNLRVRAA